MQPEAACFVAGSEYQTWTQVKQNIGDLPYDQFAGLQEGRCKWGALVARAIQHRHHTVHAAGFSSDILVGGTRILQRKPHKFAATLDLGPVEELITHGITPDKNRGLGASF